MYSRVEWSIYYYGFVGCVRAIPWFLLFSFSFFLFFFQAEDGIRDLVRSRGLGDVYKRQDLQQPMIQREKKRLHVISFQQFQPVK